MMSVQTFYRLLPDFTLIARLHKHQTDTHPDDADKVVRARALLRYLDEQEKIIMLPTPVITKCLWPVDVHARETVLNVINKFMIGAFDLAVLYPFTYRFGGGLLCGLTGTFLISLFRYASRKVPS